MDELYVLLVQTRYLLSIIRDERAKIKIIENYTAGRGDMVPCHCGPL